MLNRFAEVIQPESLRSPEVIIGAEWDTKTDIWNLGCLVSFCCCFFSFRFDAGFERIRYQPRYMNLHEDLNYSTHARTMRNPGWIHRRRICLKSPVYVVIFLLNFWTGAGSRSITLTIKVSLSPLSDPSYSVISIRFFTSRRGAVFNHTWGSTE